MHRTDFRPPLRNFQQYAMQAYPDDAQENHSRFRHSLGSPTRAPSVSTIEQMQPRSLGNNGRSWTDNFTERPNMVISGHRKLNKAYFTTSRGNFEVHANRIAAKLEEDEALMEDSLVSEQLRKDALRDLPQTLTMKRCVKMKLTKSVSQKSKRKPIGFWKRLKYRININFSKFVQSLKNFNYFELWHGSLKDIEGHFGSAYASYFKFLRWLFVMNLFVALVSFSLIVVPQIIYDSSGGVNGTINNSHDFKFKDIFTGNGFFLETVLYYGHYTNIPIEVVSPLSFDMSAAYFSVMVILYLLSFVILAVGVAQLYRRTFIETEGGLQNVYANRIFCGWDYGIATPEAAQLKSSSIYNELKELLSENDEEEDHPFIFYFWTYTIQVIVNILVLGIIAAVGWLNWVLMRLPFKNGVIDIDDDNIIITSIVNNLIIMICPTIFGYISKYEDYKNPRVTLFINLGRTYLLGAVIIGNILAFWLTRGESSDCWENRLGAEIYRLIVFDFLFSIILTIVIDLVYFVGRFFMGRDPKSEFNVAKHTLQIIYNQGLFWVGCYYSPILPIIVTVKMFIIWYVRKASVQKFCRPPKRTWRAAQAQTWFMMMTFVSILLIIAAQGYTLTSVKTSSACGPLKHYTYTYEIVTKHVEILEQNDVWHVIMSVTKPGGVALIIIALMILVYYIKEQADANREKVKMLKETLVVMAKDKKYLVQMYKHLTKGDEINPHLRDNRFLDPCKVLPHEYVEDSSSVDDDEFYSRFRTHS